MSLSKSYAEHTVLLLVRAVWLWHMRMCYACVDTTYDIVSSVAWAIAI